MSDDEDIEPEAIDLKEHLIYDGKEAVTPSGFTSRIISLDARAASPLVWKEEIAQIESNKAHNLKLLFDIDLGLFKEKNLAIQAHALDTFYETIYTHYKEDTIGVILYKGRSPLENAPLEHLEALRSYLPQDLHCLLCFDCQESCDPLTYARHFAADRYYRFVLALKNAPIQLNCCIWQEGKGSLGYIGKNVPQPNDSLLEIGILLPRTGVLDETAYSSLNETMNSYIKQGIPFKVISEEFLAQEWDGLEELIIQRTSLLPTTLRTIEGFTAAGGKVTSLNN